MELLQWCISNRVRFIYASSAATYGNGSEGFDDENGGEFNLVADDQYSVRQNKIGYFGSVEEGRVVLDNRVLVGKMVPAA